MHSAVYRPVHVKESIRYNGKLISCTEATFCMLIDATTLGGARYTEGQIRHLSREEPPDPNSPGLNIRQIDKVATLLHIPYADRSGDNWEELTRFLRAGRRIHANVWNDLLGDANRSHVGHSILLQAFNSQRTKILANNPLSMSARWYPVSTIKDAMLDFAKDSGLKNGQLRFAISRQVPKIAVP